MKDKFIEVQSFIKNLNLKLNVNEFYSISSKIGLNTIEVTYGLEQNRDRSYKVYFYLDTMTYRHSFWDLMTRPDHPDHEYHIQYISHIVEIMDNEFGKFEEFCL